MGGNGVGPRELSVKQHLSIDGWLAGKTDARIADDIGVHRVTVTNWRNHDALWQAEANRRLKELVAQETARIVAMRAKALDAVDEGLGSANPDFALRTYTALARVGLPDRLPTNPDHVLRDRAVDDVFETIRRQGGSDSHSRMIKGYTGLHKILSDANESGARYLEQAEKTLRELHLAMTTTPGELLAYADTLNRVLWDLWVSLLSSEGLGIRALTPPSPKNHDELLAEAKAALVQAIHRPRNSDHREPGSSGEDAMIATAGDLRRALLKLLCVVEGAQGRLHNDPIEGAEVAGYLKRARSAVEEQTKEKQSSKEQTQSGAALRAVWEGASNLIHAMRLGFQITIDDVERGGETADV